MERLRARKSLGQNFLVDSNVVSRIVSAVDIHSNDHILEVGPGKGVLTTLLAQYAAQVVAVELDRRMVAHLGEKFSECPSVRIVEEDILDSDLHTHLNLEKNGKWKVVANLPYNISSQVLFKFIDNRILFSDLVLMLQKEVGERLIAHPGTKEYGILSVFCQIYFDISRVLLVKPGSFRPIPKVDSIVLKFQALECPRVEIINESFFRAVVKCSFAQRRKTLWNCLKAGFKNINESEMLQMLSRCSIDPGRRGETLTLQEFAQLSNEFTAVCDPSVRTCP